MKCRYCEHWKLSKKRESGEPSKRFCSVKNKMVKKEDDVCGYNTGEFEMSEFFWCDHYNCFRPVLGCIKQYTEELDENCKGCSQGEEIELAYECWSPKIVRRKLIPIRRKLS